MNVNDTTMTETRELVEATEQLLDDATDVLLQTGATAIVLDERMADAENLLATRCNPDVETLTEQVVAAQWNLTKLTRLWRADESSDPWFGPRSCWVESREEATHYLNGRTRGFGGDTLYVVDVDASNVLWLAENPWTDVADAVGIDRADYGAGERDEDLLAALVPVFRASGYRWVVYWDHDSRGPGARTWLYCGRKPLSARPLTHGAMD